MDNVRHIVQERLCRHGVKPSLQRMAVMEYLITHKTHPTADMIFTDLYPAIPTLSKATVYNTLNLLVERGAINMITIDEKNSRFDAMTEPHIHFRCRQCGVIHDVDMPEEKIHFGLPAGTSIESVQTYCIGLCAECNKQ